MQAVPARQQPGIKAAHRDQLAAIEQLASDLEQRLRAVRRALPDQPAPARRKGKS